MQIASADVTAALRHRTAQATVTVTGPDGSRSPTDRSASSRSAMRSASATSDSTSSSWPTARPAPGPRPFGGAAVEQAEHLAELWLDLYNYATLPFYWRGFEPERGRPDTRRLHRTAQWFHEHGVAVKGHPLVWHTLAPSGCWTSRPTRSPTSCAPGSRAR